MLRGLAFSILLLLLFDPVVPGSAGDKPLGTVAIVDASLSMQVSDGARSRWQQALERAQRLPGVQRVILMGGTPRVLPRDSLGALQPVYSDSRLLPALQAAAEGGADQAVVITDGGIEDEQEVRRWLPRLGLRVEVEQVGSAVLNDRALVELTAPDWAESGRPLAVRVAVTATRAGQPIRVAINSRDAQVAVTEIAAAQPGRLSVATLEFKPPAPGAGGLLRLEAALVGSDAVPQNDRRVFYVQVGAKPAGVALVSFAPDWEPRFLHPVLVQSLGLPVRSFLRATGTTYVSAGPGTEAGKRLTEEAVRAAVAGADLVVLHGASARMPQWAVHALRTRPRVLVLPHASGIEAAPVSVSAATPGDWFVGSDLPASPVAGLLAGVPLANLPPLSALAFARELPPGGWTPLLATRGRRGAPSAVAAAYTAEGRRVVVALGSGYWRWAFRGGEQRQSYARFWGALAGWLIQQRPQLAGGAVRPAARVFEQGQPVAWIAAEPNLDSVRLRITGARGASADTTIPLEQADTAFSRTLAPGEYRYEATAFAAGRNTGSANGAFTVDTYSSEFARPTRSLADLEAAAVVTGAVNQNAGAKPLRTTIWPYLLVGLLLSSEWVLRRRWGLR